MMPVLPPSFDVVRARVNLVDSVSSYSYVDNLYFLLGWESRHSQLSDAQKQYFHTMYPIFRNLEGFLRRIRMLSAFLMFIASVLLSLPMAGVGLGIFNITLPFLIPLLVIAAIGTGVTFFLSTTVFIMQEYTLSRPSVKIPLDNIEALTKDYESNKEAMNEMVGRIDRILNYIRTHEGDPKIKKSLKNIKNFFENVERGFLYEGYLGLIVYGIVKQVESGKKKLPDDMRKLLTIFNTSSLSKLTADFLLASSHVPDLLDDSRVLLDAVEEKLFNKPTARAEMVAEAIELLSQEQKVLSERLVLGKDKKYSAIDYLTDYKELLRHVGSRFDTQPNKPSTSHSSKSLLPKVIGGLGVRRSLSSLAKKKCASTPANLGSPGRRKG